MSSALLFAWDEFMRSDGYSENTRRARIQALEAIAHYCGTKPESLTVYDVRSYLLHRQLSPWTRLVYLRHLQAWARFANIPDPTEGIRRPRQPRLLPDPLPEEHLSRLLQHLDSAIERTWVLLGAYAGLRAHEVAKLAAEDLADGTLRVLGKGGRVDVLPIAPVLADALQLWADAAGPLWPGVSAKTVNRRIQRRALKLGIPMRFHQLRHRFGTAVYAATHDLLLTQQLMRHASPQTTAGYAAVANARSTSVVSSLPGGDHIPKE